MTIRLSLLMFALAGAPVAFGQLETDTISVAASRTMNASVERLEITVIAVAPIDVTFDAVVQALLPAGISAANLTGADSYSLSASPGITTSWQFVLRVSFADSNRVIRTLAGLKPGSGIEVSHYIQGAGDPLVCPWQTLLNDAQTQAQKVASAAGVRLGQLVGLSDQNDAPAAYQLIASFRLGFLVAPRLFPTTCSLTAKFKLLR